MPEMKFHESGGIVFVPTKEEKELQNLKKTLRSELDEVRSIKEELIQELKELRGDK